MQVLVMHVLDKLVILNHVFLNVYLQVIMVILLLVQLVLHLHLVHVILLVFNLDMYQHLLLLLMQHQLLPIHVKHVAQMH